MSPNKLDFLAITVVESIPSSRPPLAEQAKKDTRLSICQAGTDALPVALLGRTVASRAVLVSIFGLSRQFYYDL